MNHSKTNNEKIARTPVETPGKPAFANKPITTDVLIVGAGPAGAAAAITLARAGREVLIIDQHDFPRDKICGDGLIPDALQALTQLGVLDQVRALAKPVKGITCHGPKGGVLDIPSGLAVLPRKALDQLLVQAAIAAGATFQTPYRYSHPVTDGDRTVGAIAQGPSDTLDIKANWTIMATGATVAALQSADRCTRALPSAMALRSYVHNPTFKGLNERLHISWHKSYAPGYGWIFPCPDGVFNIGVGLYGMHTTSWRHRLAQLSGLGRLRPSKPNLNALFKLFISTNPLAQSLMEKGTLMGDIKGAPLRCSLEGAKPASAGLLVTGEAVGSTYALTGEGIGKAMETGILAAQSLLARLNDAQTIAHYETALNQLTPKFDIYRRANVINHMPWLIELAIKRGNKSPKLVKRMSLVLEEKANPAKLFTARGAWKFLTD